MTASVEQNLNRSTYIPPLENRKLRLPIFDYTKLNYISLEADASGVIKSQVYPGLWLDVKALLAGDMAKVLAVLQQGLSSSEYVSFAQKLAKL